MKVSWREENEDEGVDVSMGGGVVDGSKRRTRFRRGHGNRKKRRGDIEMGMIGSEVTQISRNAIEEKEEEGEEEMRMGMGRMERRLRLRRMLSLRRMKGSLLGGDNGRGGCSGRLSLGLGESEVLFISYFSSSLSFFWR